LVTAPVGGDLKSGRRSLVIERTFATARSIEFDAVIIAAGTSVSNDVKLEVMLQEAFRHCKPLGAWGDGVAVLEAAGIDPDAAGILVGDESDKAFGEGLITALGLHRVWERAETAIASVMTPAKAPAKRAAAAKSTLRKKTGRRPVRSG
jgi:catalase